MSTASARINISPFSFRRTFALQALGAYDPTATLSDRQFSKSFATASGPCTVTIEAVEGGVQIACDGAEAEETLEELTRSFRADDGYDSFLPEHPVLRRLRNEQRGLRLLRVPWLFDIACSAVLQQRVRSTDAMREWSRICSKFGARPSQGRQVFPAPAVLASIPLHELQGLGIDPRRSRTLLAIAREIRLHPLRREMTREQIRLRLSRIPGIGSWTTEMILGFGTGDRDALPLGDLYLPHLVSFALTGERRGSDERMIELLEPFRPHRFRVVRLLYATSLRAA